jgi:aspartyl-tRNA(Asn)/glutamyl-tRNA(Gln) amidotransferase subunit A
VSSAQELPSGDLAYLSAVELGLGFRERTFSSVEVTNSILERIDQLNPMLNAFITVTADLARRQAEAADAAFARGETDQPLLGIPLSLKDLLPTRGIRTTRGSALTADWVPDFDALVAERVYEAGAVLLGKTNTPEFGWKGATSNLLMGPTRNPWNLERTSGGSSGGAAAALAAGLGPLAHGSDGAGSIRIPAAFCGVFGLKPSCGLVPAWPTSPNGSLSHQGPMARTVRDAALLLGALAGADERDRFSFGERGTDYVAAAEGGIDGFRVAFSPGLGFATVETEVAEIVAQAAQSFEALGCEVEEASPALADPWPALDVAWATAQAARHADDLDDVRDRIDPGRVAVIERGLRASGVDVARAHSAMVETVECLRMFMEPFDLLLTPTLPITAFAADADQPGSVAGKPTSYLSWSPFTYPFNVTGQPAASVPCGFASDGLPVGLQIVGRWHDDVSVLRAAAAYEEAHPWAHIKPALGPD